MTPVRLVSFRRVVLAEAAPRLSPDDFRLLVLLALSACPRTGRVWTTPLRLAEELGTAPVVIDAALQTLLAAGHITLYARSRAALRCYELGPVFQRALDEPPENLPVEPAP